MNTSRRAYKEIRLQQLRSICAAARKGSLSGAAKELGVSQPAVWEQVRALEREFDAPLIEAHGRGCRLTEAGELLVELADPVVSAADSLKRAFQERRAQVVHRLTVAATQRILVEDLREVVPRFIASHPRTRLRFLERPTGQVSAAVESGEADIGVASDREPASPWLATELAYHVDVILLARHDHPLTRQRTFRLRDLLAYPLVNAADSFARPELARQLAELGVFRSEPRTVEAASSVAVRHFVQLGLGVGMVLGQMTRRGRPTLHERNLSRFFGRAGINLVRRKGVVPTTTTLEFAAAVRERLGNSTPR